MQKLFCILFILKRMFMYDYNDKIKVLIPYPFLWIVCLLLASFGFLLILTALGEFILRLFVALFGCWLISLSMHLFTGQSSKDYVMKILYRRLF
jgi:hypothetical protein